MPLTAALHRSWIRHRRCGRNNARGADRLTRRRVIQQIAQVTPLAGGLQAQLLIEIQSTGSPVIDAPETRHITDSRLSGLWASTRSCDEVSSPATPAP